MKILSAKQLYQALTLSIKNQQTSELDLLDRAGDQVFNWMHTRMQGSQVKIHIFNGDEIFQRVTFLVFNVTPACHKNVHVKYM